MWYEPGFNSSQERFAVQIFTEKGPIAFLPISNTETSVVYSIQDPKNIDLENLIKKFYKETKGKIKIIGVGGVDSGQSAYEKITAGADAVQLYTGMVYKGPGIVKEIKKDLVSILKKEKIENISEAVGINA